MVFKALGTCRQTELVIHDCVFRCEISSLIGAITPGKKLQIPMHRVTCLLDIHAGSFNDWESPIPLRRINPDDDFVRSVVLPPGLVEYKFVVDDVWCHSPRDAIKVDESTSSINNRKVVETNSRITWRSTGTDKEVFMTGSFLAWSEVVPLKRKPNGFFEADCCFPVIPTSANAR